MQERENGRFKAKEISLVPTRELGYLCGLILGDGSLIHHKDKALRIRFGSTKEDFINLASIAVKRAFPQLHICRSSEFQTKTFPDGTVRTCVQYRATIYSKKLYDALQPYKLSDYRWIIPSFLKTNDEAVLGFLRGLFDAEGYASCYMSNTRGRFVGLIGLSSKHRENLVQIQSILLKLGIRNMIYKHQSTGYQLRIHDELSKKRFADLIGFGIDYKMRALKRDLNRYRQHREPKSVIDRLVPQMVKLRKQNLTISQIAEVTGIPSMTVWRRLSRIEGYRRFRRGRKTKSQAQAVDLIGRQSQVHFLHTTMEKPDSTSRSYQK